MSQNDLIRKTSWSLDTYFLSDFVQRHKLPVLAKVTKGQYLNLGVSSSGNLNPYVLICSHRKNAQKLIGRLVKWKDGKIATILDQRVQFSREFSGYFEILSEDGRPTRGLESVQELCDFFPDACIVRGQNFKVHLPGPDGEMAVRGAGAGPKTRILANGEILTLVGLFNFKHEKFLRCFDESGKSVFLKLDDKNVTNGQQKCTFTPIVTDDEAISGAHRAVTLVKKRLPITVRMIAGPMQSHLVGSSGHPVIRIEKTLVEEEIHAYSLPTHSDGQFLKLPINAHLKLVSAVNRPNYQYSTDPSFIYILDRCQKIRSNLNDRITFYKQSDFSSNSKDSSSSAATENSMMEEIDADSGFNDEEIEELYNYIRGAPPPPPPIILERSSRTDQQHLHKSKRYSKSTEKLFELFVVRRDRSSSKNNQNKITKPVHQQSTVFSPLQPLKFWQNYRRGSVGIAGYSNKNKSKNQTTATPMFRSIGETKGNNCSPRAYKSCHNLLEQCLAIDDKPSLVKRQSRFTLYQGK